LKQDSTPSPTLSWVALRELSNRSFFHFVRLVNPAPPGCLPIDRDIHKPLCDFFQSKGSYRKVIAMPRDWLKSTVFTKWGAIWLYLQDPETRILIAAENERLAGRFLHWIQQQLLNNRFLREMYPELKPIDQAWTRSHRWSASECDLPRVGTYSEPTFTAIGVGGAAQSGHYTQVLIDDLVGKKAKESLLVLESVLRWFDNAPELLVQPHKDMPNPSSIHIHGTFWFPGDFLCYVRDKYPEFEFRVVPCRKRDQPSKFENITYVQNEEAEVGESNWDQFPTEYYIQMLANPEKNIDYWAQHMNDPEQSSELTNFDTAWLRYYHIVERDGHKYIVCDDDKEEFRVGSFPLQQFVDPGGFSDKRLTKTGSRFAVMCGGQPNGSRKKFITYAHAFRFKEPDKAMDEVFKCTQYFKPILPSLIRQERYGQQYYILADIRKEAERRKIPVRVVELKADEKKDSKANNIDAIKSPMFNGDVYIHRSMKELISEIQVYPNGMTKDLVDLLGQMMKHCFKRNEVKQEPPRPTSKQVYGNTSQLRTGY
jgi:hypothetical protein